MPPVSILLNVLWLLIGGLYMAAAWVLAGVIMAITIVGLPWARAAFNIAVYAVAIWTEGGAPRRAHRAR